MVSETSPMLTIVVDGRPFAVAAGQSVAAALLAHEIVALRTTRQGRPRGMFCAMGVCFDCLAEVDGQPHRRTCMEAVRDGMIVRLDGGGHDASQT